MTGYGVTRRRRQRAVSIALALAFVLVSALTGPQDGAGRSGAQGSPSGVLASNATAGHAATGVRAEPRLTAGRHLVTPTAYGAATVGAGFVPTGPYGRFRGAERDGTRQAAYQAGQLHRGRAPPGR